MAAMRVVPGPAFCAAAEETLRAGGDPHGQSGVLLQTLEGPVAGAAPWLPGYAGLTPRYPAAALATAIANPQTEAASRLRQFLLTGAAPSTQVAPQLDHVPFGVLPTGLPNAKSMAVQAIFSLTWTGPRGDNAPCRTLLGERKAEAAALH